MSRDIGKNVIADQTAPRPCHPCKSRKRRCGKELPECELCLRTGRRCRYESSRIEPPKAPPPHQSIGQDVIRNNFPAAYFLDRQLFNHCQVSIQKPQIFLPLGDFDCLKNEDSVYSIASHFFRTIHLWLPILSRSKFYGLILHQQVQKEVDLRLLVTCMHILLPRQNESSQSRQTTYSSLKCQFVSVEQAGVLTITVLQSMILIAFYELGHGIYPAVFLTVGTCARYAVALGLNRDISLWDHTDSGWAAMEERHRAWWAVVILERYMNIDSPRRHLCTPDPSENHLLPLSDNDWNNGIVRGAPYTVSAPTNSNMGKFARLAQASHLLGRVMRHISDTQADAQFLDAEKNSLDQALRSLLALTVAEEQECGIAYCSPVALVSSALLLLHSYYRVTSTTTDNDTADNSYRGITELTSKVTLPIARRLKEPTSSDMHTPCPLLVDWIYRSAIAYQDVQRTEDTDALSNYIETMREAMEELSRHWGVGVFYINMLETRSEIGLMPGIPILND